MTKPLTKVWKCPTCCVGFMAGETRQGTKAGRTCPDGHFHSYYDYQRFEAGKPFGTGRLSVVRNPKPARPIASSDMAETLAVLWIGSYDRLMSQLPKGMARDMVEGALTQAYRVSQRIIEPTDQQERAVA